MIITITKKLKLTILISLLTVLATLPLSIKSASALGGSYFILTPNSGTYQVGDFLTVKVEENSGSTGINFAEADLNYDKNLLSFVSFNSAQSDFPALVQENGGGGLAGSARGILSNNGQIALLTGTKTLTYVTFKVLAAGATSVSLANTSSIKAPSADLTTIKEDWNGVTAGATFTFKAPVTDGGGTTTGGGSTGGGGSTSSGSKSSISSGGSTTAIKAGASSTAPPATTQPVQQSVSGAEDEGTQVLTPTSHMVSVKILNDKGKPVTGAEVKLGNQTDHTISNGTASFIGIEDGSYKITVSYKGKTTSKQINVDATGQPASSVQNFEVKLTGTKGLPTWIIYSIIGLIVLFILGFLIPRKKPKFAYMNPVDPQSVVIGGSNQVNAPVQTVKPVAPPAPLPPTQTPVAPGTSIEPENPPGQAESQDNKINNNQ